MDLNKRYDKDNIEEVEKLVTQKIEDDGVGTLCYEIIEIIANVQKNNVKAIDIGGGSDFETAIDESFG